MDVRLLDEGRAGTGCAVDDALTAVVTDARSTDRLRETTGGAAPRRAWARAIPVPDSLDFDEAALVAAPWSPAWNTAPADTSAWVAQQQQHAAAVVPRIAAMRSRYGVSLEKTRAGGVDALMLRPQATRSPGSLIISLHGGGFVLGKGEAGTMEATMLAALVGSPVLSIDYRLAYDMPFPAALDDALAAWRGISAEAAPARIMLVGTSAGGGLALSLLLALKRLGLPMPGAVALNSPWADMTRCGDSYAANDGLDNVLVSYDGYLRCAAHLYAGGRELGDPLLSPIYDDLGGLPPVVLFTGSRDLFLSNTIRTHRKLRAAGNPAELHVFEALSHCHSVLNTDTEAGRQHYHDLGEFYSRHCSAATTLERDRVQSATATTQPLVDEHMRQGEDHG